MFTVGFLSLIAGVCVGSFLNMLIDRIPRDEQIVSGRSKCDVCHHELFWKDLIPVFSWILLHGRCRYCHASIPWRNTVVEIITGLLFGAVFYYHMDTLLMGGALSHSIVIADLALVSLLIAITFIDLEHMIIPDILLAWAVFITVILFAAGRLPGQLGTHLYAGIGAGLFFIVLVLITRGRWMGLGDVKYALFMGLLLGFPGIIYGMYTAFLTGAFISVMLILKRKKRFGQTIPFGPFLVGGTLVAHYKLLEPLGVFFTR